jgi:hypothetical protein
MYDNFAAWVPDLDAVLHPNQSAELGTDGMFREDSAGGRSAPCRTSWGIFPGSRRPDWRAEPWRLFLKASRGDLDKLPDSGIDDIRPGCTTAHRGCSRRPASAVPNPLYP